MIKALVTSGILVAASAGLLPARAAPNLIVNGSFENGFAGFSHTGTSGLSNPAVVIGYGNGNGYPLGAYGENIPVDNTASPSPDAAGSHGAYFVDDFAKDEAIGQLTLLGVGNYEIGFSAYLPGNGFANPVDANFSGKIIGASVTSFTVSQGISQSWVLYSGVANISKAGYYATSFDFNSFGFPSKDVVIDRVFAMATSKPATINVPPTPTAAVPEPATWALFVTGFGLVGCTMRRRTGARVAA